MSKAVGYVWRMLWLGRGPFRPVWLLLVLLLPVGGWLVFDRILTLLDGPDRSNSSGEPAKKGEAGLADNSLIRVYFPRSGSGPTPTDNIFEILADWIDQAQQTLDVCAFELDNRTLTEALVRAVGRGVKVRLVTETPSSIQTLRGAGVGVVDARATAPASSGQDPVTLSPPIRPVLMHGTFLVFDKQAVWIGSLNVTERLAGLRHQPETLAQGAPPLAGHEQSGLYIADQEVAANFATRFAWMFEQSAGRADPMPRIPYPNVTLRDGTRIETYFAPQDRVAERLIEKIGQAKSSIHFLAFSFTHEGLTRAILDRARAGIPIQGVFERTQASEPRSEYARFYTSGPGVQVYLASPHTMHHTVILLDGETTVAGSLHFSEGADPRQETAVVIHDRKVAQQFEEEFFRIYDAARKTSGGVAALRVPR